jgi:hypothetical protein
MVGFGSIGRAVSHAGEQYIKALWRLHGVVVAALFFDQDLGFAQHVEELTVGEFIAEAGIEAFSAAILPR